MGDDQRDAVPGLDWGVHDRPRAHPHRVRGPARHGDQGAGSFDEFTGTAHLDGDNPNHSSVALTIRANSIDTRNADRDAHLRSNDFL
jgi:polyisoprenoid-binding protein YceI